MTTESSPPAGGPPLYSAHSYADVPPTAVLLNLTPLSATGSHGFQVGHLGYGPASLEGELQVKWSGSPQSSPPRFSSLVVVFRGVETGDDEDRVTSIELCEHKQVLWGLGAAGSSTVSDGQANGNSAYADMPPSSLVFKLELTPDLPHCIHLGRSSLEYTLTAILSHQDSSIPPLTHSVPVHLARTSAPDAINLAASIPSTISVREPIQLSARLRRTTFRRSEPIELAVRIEVPSVQAVQDQGLRLRTVSAQLVRKIASRAVDEEQAAVVGGSDVDRLPTEKASDEHLEHSAVPKLPSETTAPHITVLTRSGKSARFSPTRPIVIRLLLHPPTESLSCESISQSTILHNITFEVQVTVGLVSTRASNSSSSSSTGFEQHQNRDCILTQTVTVIPDSPSPSAASEKQRQLDSTEPAPSPPPPPTPSWMPADGPVPTYHESAAQAQAQAQTDSSWTTDRSSPPPLSPATPSSSSNAHGKQAASEDEDAALFAEEYDGYEEMSASLSTLAPPPTIDEDVSPPSPSASTAQLQQPLLQDLQRPVERDGGPSFALPLAGAPVHDTAAAELDVTASPPSLRGVVVGADPLPELDLEPPPYVRPLSSDNVHQSADAASMICERPTESTRGRRGEPPSLAPPLPASSERLQSSELRAIAVVGGPPPYTSHGREDQGQASQVSQANADTRATD